MLFDIPLIGLNEQAVTRFARCSLIRKNGRRTEEIRARRRLWLRLLLLLLLQEHLLNPRLKMLSSLTDLGCILATCEALSHQNHKSSAGMMSVSYALS